jgi:murein DD-endopeptidase MepM/ murein hydrolase activator NlpD
VKSLINILILCVFTLSLHAKGVCTGHSKTGPTSNSDTVRYHVNNEEITEEDEFDTDMDFVNVSYLPPAYSLYSVWDTFNINPYKFDLSDTLTLFLSDKYDCSYVPPIKGNVTSPFGPRRRNFHCGIDLDLETGDTVVSAFDGTVRVARVANGYGNVVVIRHNNGLETLYGHLSEIKVQVGQHVSGGDILGLGGNTGRSTGSHLHFEVRFNGKPINPESLISFKSFQLLNEQLTISPALFKQLSTYKKVGTKGKGGKYYVVRKGDTLYKIAKRKGTTVKKLCKLNGLKPTTILAVGKRIRCV